MELKDLMSGIGVVIDDAFDNAGGGEANIHGNADPIFKIVEQIEQEWDLPFYKASSIPSEPVWSGLLQAASFILLDWRLWPPGGAELEQVGIETNVQFLNRAKDYFLPVFIFTNESAEDVTTTLPEAIYPADAPEQSFVFVRNKAALLSNGTLEFNDIEQWVRGNASVYALKTWERVLHSARKELFGAMYARSSDWPRVFWKAYQDDGVDPSSSLTHLINDSLRGRMRTSAFEAEILALPPAEVSGRDLRALIGETSFRPVRTLPDYEIGCGDVFQLPQGKFLLNLRPDCDCVPRDGQENGDVELYCIEGRKMRDRDLRDHYLKKQGHFDERVWESVAFSVQDGSSIRFDFKKFRVDRVATLRDQLIGRLLHPHLTRIQQRFGLYLQRQGLPRIPEEAIPAVPPPAGDAEP